jgi:hypothetical protein
MPTVDEWLEAVLPASPDGPQSPLEDWLGVLSQLWTAFGKTPAEEQLAVYQQTLGTIPLGLLEPAIQEVLRSHRYNSVPTIGDVIAAIRQVLGDPNDLQQAIEDWQDSCWRKCVVQVPPKET